MEINCNKWSKLLLILAICLASLPACDQTSSTQPENSQEEAVLLMVAGLANLGLSEVELMATVSDTTSDGRIIPVVNRTAAEPATVNEIKVWMEQFSAQCDRLRQTMETTLQGDQKESAIALFDQHCQAQLARLSARAQALEKARQSRAARGLNFRKFFRWFRITVVEEGLKDVAMTYLTGGGGMAFGKLVRHELTNRFRREATNEVKSWAGRRLSRKGVPDEVLALLKLPAGARQQPLATTDETKLPDTGNWTADCEFTAPVEDWIMDYVIQIDLSARHFTSSLDAIWDEQRSDHEVRHNTWKTRGAGTLFEDGMIEGPYSEVIEGQSLYSNGSTSNLESYSYSYLLYGALTSDLKSLCVSRGGEHPQFDADFVRAYGREQFCQEYAEAVCTVTVNP